MDEFGNLFPSDNFDPSIGFDTSGLDFTNSGGGSSGWFDFGTDVGAGSFDPSGLDIPVYTDTPNLPPISPSDSSGWDLTSIISNVKSVFQAALELNNAYKNAGKPPVRTSSPSTSANANGTLSTQTASGGTVTTRMPPNQPYLTASGVMVMNNGNGTYTVTNPDGSSVTRPYPASPTAAGGSNALLYVGLGVGALLLLSRSK